MKSVHHHLPTKPFSIPCLKTSWVGGTKNWHLYDLAKGRVWNLIKTHFWWNWWNSFGDKAKNGHRTENVDFFLCIFCSGFGVCRFKKKSSLFQLSFDDVQSVSTSAIFPMSQGMLGARLAPVKLQLGKNPHGCQLKLWWKFCLTRWPITKKLQATVGIWDFIRS